ncbi:hypothetical protein GCM10023157_05620 [Gluconacetobacter asukensis]
MRDVVRDHVVEHLGNAEAVLVVDETGFLKKGSASCGVGRQYTRSAGKITNCQIGLFVIHVSSRGHALRPAGKGFVLGVNANHWFHSWRPDIHWSGEAREIIKTLPDEAWVRCSAGRGTKGERLYDWLHCPMADLEADEYSDTSTGIWTRGLLARRNPVEGVRWRIEEGFETAKNEFGLDHNETRSWHGWHRHISLVMLAYAMMTAVRSRANVMALKKANRTNVALIR